MLKRDPLKVKKTNSLKVGWGLTILKDMLLASLGTPGKATITESASQGLRLGNGCLLKRDSILPL